jgi:hypothetical protein
MFFIAPLRLTTLWLSNEMVRLRDLVSHHTITGQDLQNQISNLKREVSNLRIGRTQLEAEARTGANSLEEFQAQHGCKWQELFEDLVKYKLHHGYGKMFNIMYEWNLFIAIHRESGRR